MKRYLIFLFFCIISACMQAQVSTQNYLQTRTRLTERGDTCIERVRYYDGLGRPFQEMTRNYPFAAADSSLVTLQEYDKAGRPDVQYLPVPGKENYIDADDFYFKARSYYEDTKPCASTKYEASSLNRITTLTAPGSDWRNHPETIGYKTNATSGDWCCARYDVDFTGNLVRNGNYAAGHLMVVQNTDEDGHVSYTFTDMQGRTILTRQMDGTTRHDTHYVYDQYGNLCYVLPPMVNDTVSQDNLDKYTYRYKYDHRNRCIEKKLPGAAPVTYAYDAADHLTLMQDGNMRREGKYRLYLYDRHDRLVIQGIVDQALIATVKSIDERVVSCNYNNRQVNLMKIDPIPMPEIYLDLPGTGYRTNLYGLSVLPQYRPLYEIINYYDDYNFTCSLDGFKDIPYTAQYVLPGTLTGRIVAQASNYNSRSYELYAYNEKGELTSILLHNSLSHNRKTDYAYSFTGKPVTKKCDYFTGIFGTIGANTVLSEKYTYVYDKKDLLTCVKHKLNNGPEVQLSALTYDALGRLASKNFHGSTALGFHLGYVYNIRGWLAGINGRLLSQRLCYNDSDTPCYNGNISRMEWCTRTSSQQLVFNEDYKFTYDGLNRLKSAIHNGNSLDLFKNHYDEEVTAYDKNGNILGLKRRGQTGPSTYGVIDDLKITLNGNQLKSVNDAAAVPGYGSMHFNDGIQLDTEYAYDNNGNLTKDSNKNIADIQYNYLNLPSTVIFSDGSSIAYTYGADGTKLRMVHHITGLAAVTRDYCGNLLFENGVQKLLLTEEGYVSLTDNKYHYYLKDHQGNNRVVLNESGTVEETTSYYPFGGIAQSTGNVQPYKYNGKELDREKGLDWYDYGARMYDAVLGRWNAVDPLAEKYYEMSPYVYCANDPVKNVDSDGRWFWAAAGAAIDYGFQVYNNYSSGKSGYDAWVGDVNFVSVGLSAINPVGKFKVAKTLAIEAVKETISYTANKGFRAEDDVTTITTNALISTAVSVSTGKLTESSSNKALENVNKEMRTANQNVRTAQNRVNRHPTSESKRMQLDNAKSNAQHLRTRQIGTQMLNSTIGQINPNIVEQTVTNGTSKFGLKMDWNDEK